MNDLDKKILAFEQGWWQQRGRKEAAIVRDLGMSVVRYTQRLNNLLDDLEAQQLDPLLVSRLRRIRDQRNIARAQRRDLA